jgi:HAD superfamily hydrolase (TIGR01509 family)
MDGVLLDSEPLHYEALSRVLAEDGFEWTERENEQLLGTTVADTFRIIGESLPLTRTTESYLGIYEARVIELLSRPLEPAPGVKPLLARLKSAHVPLAVASSSQRSWIQATLRSLDVAQFFDVVVSGDEVARGKPEPDVYLRTADLLDVFPGRCTAIEDAPNGVLSAKRAGMYVVAVRTPYTRLLTLEGADVVVDTLEGIDDRTLGLDLITNH